jgi:hypothetical protein
VASSAPATLTAPPLDLPWTLTGGRGLFGLDPVHGALLLWAALMGFTLLFVILSALLTRWQWGRLNRADARAVAADSAAHDRSPLERAQLRAEAGELIRQAAATAAAAKHAEVTVAEAHAMCEVTQHTREAAWVAFDAAQRAYEAALREASTLSLNGHGANGHGSLNGDAANTAAGDDRTDDASAASGEIAMAVASTDDHEKGEVARAALAAFKRGDLTVDELGAVFRQASGWDPMQELQAREVELRRTAETRARRLYQAAAAAERAAMRAADVATVAAHALAEEAIEMAEEAQAVRDELNESTRVQAIPRQRVARPRIPRPQDAQRGTSKQTGARTPKQQGARTPNQQQDARVPKQQDVRVPVQLDALVPKQQDGHRQVSRT